MGRRDVCAKCGGTLAERVRWWLGPRAPGVYRAGGPDLTGLFAYCRHCQKAICGGCVTDLGMSGGCPFCGQEAREFTHGEIEALLGEEPI